MIARFLTKLFTSIDANIYLLYIDLNFNVPLASHLLENGRIKFVGKFTKS